MNPDLYTIPKVLYAAYHQAIEMSLSHLIRNVHHDSQDQLKLCSPDFPDWRTRYKV